jgi:RNA polymerase sigma-70 factor (ECF subfamily)
LRGEGAVHHEAVKRLHALLLSAARTRLRQRASSPQLRGEDLEDVATEAADDALVTVLAHLGEFRGASRFTTWVWRFAIVEASDALRRRMWKGQEVPLDRDWAGLGACTPAPEEQLERLEVLEAVRRTLGRVLTEQQREVFVAVALNDVPVDVVAARRGSSRGAVYKTLYDARRKLRMRLEPSANSASAAAPARSVSAVDLGEDLAETSVIRREGPARPVPRAR